MQVDPAQSAATPFSDRAVRGQEVPPDQSRTFPQESVARHDVADGQSSAAKPPRVVAKVVRLVHATRSSG